MPWEKKADYMCREKHVVYLVVPRYLHKESVSPTPKARKACNTCSMRAKARGHVMYGPQQGVPPTVMPS